MMWETLATAWMQLVPPFGWRSARNPVVLGLSRNTRLQAERISFDSGDTGTRRLQMRSAISSSHRNAIVLTPKPLALRRICRDIANLVVLKKERDQSFNKSTSRRTKSATRGRAASGGMLTHVGGSFRKRRSRGGRR